VPRSPDPACSCVSIRDHAHGITMIMSGLIMYMGCVRHQEIIYSGKKAIFVVCLLQAEPRLRYREIHEDQGCNPA
jgi:hypothetical protein